MSEPLAAMSWVVQIIFFLSWRDIGNGLKVTPVLTKQMCQIVSQCSKGDGCGSYSQLA